MRAGLFQRGQSSDVAHRCVIRVRWRSGRPRTQFISLRFLGWIGRDTRKPDIGRNAETDTDRYEIRIDG